ncbi:hypothetical protein J40TS1_19410 [Paenibacillus montaniterrae]|uniref:Uncharacterized protein n=1 Tax=Paenibacillus montaniterrae TaxID=429341 RepID=A0A920CYR8_9BACL|nr:hypothetical protein [Paenibacillus montaniterrae]GIP16299.1 hypothetical protein J40TS1_19410 [Paenibacillus montaniterrae]
MYDIQMDLVADWVSIVKEVFRGSGIVLEDGLTEDDIAEIYFLQSLPEQEALPLAKETLRRLREMEETIVANMDTLIVPDIRKRTGYEGNTFHFSWVYDQGEHIVETCSEYRIPLNSQ